MATKEHCFYCFDVLIAHLEGLKAPGPTFEEEEYPLFVTWTKKSHGEDELRGCIGNFHPMPLHDGLQTYALTSAKDRRFDHPIQLKEVPRLSCSVSLLTDFEEGNNELDWELGKHGIWIEFKDDQDQRHTATYLPDVPLDQGWTKEETIKSLLRKAGYQGRTNPEIQLTRYQSSKATVSYQEYLEQQQEPPAVDAKQ